MTQQVYINLPVEDLSRSVAFFTSLGYSANPKFSNEMGACIIVSDTIFVMLLTHEHFKSFAPNPIADATKTTEVLICLSCESREQVDALADKAIAAGGRSTKEPMDMGFMYGRSFQDLDGHGWELMHMDESKAPNC